ncbi:sensor histidine kinase [Streptococcus mitis]|uniref:sensor histidine kinase n=1 Tax=Streptococcus sp. KHUD_015 TaxID=3434352 RepID=UPI001291F3B5|nr:sensor histidine kinase [Streptococcus mitis]MQQ13553.1 sensor histidine kinase [Streptococcus mitis]MQQ44277.1 sensor histidine kinase [Streptococcus mitis]MQQ46108.1 sensor histidine kinase [Streptococcus mitis]MQQ57708.1 sensor histidine kinase [Streptococcus mitis]
MKLNHDLSKKHSIHFFFKLLLVLLLINILINIAMSNITRNFIKNQNIVHLRSSIEIYADSVNEKLHSVERFMYSTITHNEPLEKLNHVQTFLEYQENLKKVQTSFTEFEYQNETHMTFLLETDSTEHFINVSNLYIPYEDYLLLKTNLKSLRSDISDRKWKNITTKNSEYLVKSVHYEGKIIYAVISSEDILKPLRKLNIGNNGKLSLKEPNNIPSENYLIHAQNEKTHLPFDIYVLVDYAEVFRNITLLEVFLSAVPIIITILSIIIILYIRQWMIKPITRLTERLSQLGDSIPPSEFFISEGILEIDKANDKLNKVIFDMQELKIREYHSQLELKKIELNYLKNQIRPHFYLNMLSMIHSMLQTKNYKEIEELTILTSNYLRHLFMANQDFSELKDEVQHIKDYLEIQRIRYGNSIYFSLDYNSELQNTLVPSLLLQTFIENTIKHGFSFQDLFTILLSIKKVKTENSDYIQICIEDNGPGFSEEILSKLNQKQSLITEDGHHIGITNTIERLNLLYPNDYTITFENNEEGGAKILLLIPYKIIDGGYNEYLIS